MINTLFGLRRPHRHRVGRRHRARQRGLRPDVRRLGLPAGAVPVRAAVRADDGARRHRRRSCASSGRPGRLHPRRAAAQLALRRWATSTCARRRSTRARIVDTAALDRYLFVRNAYLQRRRYLVYDGKPPPEPEDDIDDDVDRACVAARRARLIAAAALCVALPRRCAQEAPDALVKRVSQDVLRRSSPTRGPGRQRGAHPRGDRGRSSCRISTSRG